MATNSTNGGSNGGRSVRGFAAMDPAEQRAIARKGGEAVSQDREHMAAIGRKGGEASGGGNRGRSGAEDREEGGRSMGASSGEGSFSRGSSSRDSQGQFASGRGSSGGMSAGARDDR